MTWTQMCEMVQIHVLKMAMLKWMKKVGCYPQALKIARNDIWRELEFKWFEFSFYLILSS
jgi:hypothetical protein